MASKEGDGRAEWIPSAPGKKLSTEDDGSARFYVFWRKPEEWASDIEAWVDATAQRGVVLTLYELGEGDATRGEAWHGMEAELLARVLGISGRRGRAQVFGKEGGEGVKFF
jgi:ESCRT-II complex subunit VPS25